MPRKLPHQHHRAGDPPALAFPHTRNGRHLPLVFSAIGTAVLLGGLLWRLASTIATMQQATNDLRDAVADFKVNAMLKVDRLEVRLLAVEQRR